LEDSSSLEWLEADGLGGFAMGTVSGANTRRYHSLLTAANPANPSERIRLVSKLEEELIFAGNSYQLSTNFFGDISHPNGHQFIERFSLSPFPTWIFSIGELRLEKRLFMVSQRRATALCYRLLGPSRSRSKSVKLKIRPLFAFVGYHHLQREHSDFDVSFTVGERLVTLKHSDESLPDVAISHNAAAVHQTGYWYRNFFYPIEAERGFDAYEDLFQPFELEFDLRKPANIIISSGRPIEWSAFAGIERSELRRRLRLAKPAGEDTVLSQLFQSADQYLIKRGSGRSIIAGYPWFTDWGRDTMISLPGLLLFTSRVIQASDILYQYSKYLEQGLIPNRFPDWGTEPEYNTVDATLWFIEAVRALLEYSDKKQQLADYFFPIINEIIEHHIRGTLYNIRLDTDGLLIAGESDTQLTWMDAKSAGRSVTPRIGKPVEIQALWYNALRAASELADKIGKANLASKFKAMADLAYLSFNAVFWNAEKNCLFDVVNNGSRDDAIRPNQIFSISLNYPVLSPERWPQVMDCVEKQLYTPLGLRTLSPADPNYCPRYIGGPDKRDSAYHQGTVWAWLIGHFFEAYEKTFPGSEKMQNLLNRSIAALTDHVTKEGCLGHVSEIFDAEERHTPRGAPAQAWSLAETIRLLHRKRV
jgi:predicted glycogen debranching enzyme